MGDLEMSTRGKLKTLRFIAISVFGTTLFMASAANAIIVATPLQASNPLTISASVTSTATPSIWNYTYSITNSATWITYRSDQDKAPLQHFNIPYFDDAGITNITSPDGWSYRINDNNNFGLTGAKTLEWYASVRLDIPFCVGNGNTGCILSGIDPGSMVSGFGFDGAFGPAKAPYEATFAQVTSPYTFFDRGDPPIPASPDALNAGLQPQSTVPEPGTLALIFSGFCAIGLLARIKRRKPKGLLNI